MNNDPQPSADQTPVVQPTPAIPAPDVVPATDPNSTLVVQPPQPTVQTVVAVPPLAKKSKKGMIIAIVSIVILALAGVAGYVLYQNSQQQQRTATDASATSKDVAKSASSTPLVGTLPDITTKPNVIPTGWKKFTSKKYGLSFATPKDWIVTESDQTTSAIPAYSVTVIPQNDPTIGVYISIIKKDLKDITVPPAGSTAQDMQKGTSIATLKWNGHDAAIASTTSTYPDGKSYTGKILVVQVGDMLYQLPTSQGQSPAVILKKITQQDWDTFNNTFDIKG